MGSDIQCLTGYLEALKQAKNLISAGQEKFLKSANRTSMEIRLNLGMIIDNNSLRYDWGKSVLETFSQGNYSPLQRNFTPIPRVIN